MITPCPSHRRPFIPPPNLKGIFAGSGNAGMGDPYIARAVVDLVQKPPHQVSLMYLGTATYDIDKFRENQTKSFLKLGCHVRSLDVANNNNNNNNNESSESPPLSLEDMAEAVDKADIILVSGGNTQYAVDRWKYLGLDELLKDASLQGTVMCGGSAGAICWFDGGHSDSMDPDTYRVPMLEKFQPEPTIQKISEKESSQTKKAAVARSAYFDEGTNTIMSNPQEGAVKEWEYIRVEGLSILPGLICPHFDRVQSNGIARMIDFDSMMKRHSSELGIGIDHYAALEIDGEDFRILSIPGQKGSIGDAGDEPGTGTPGAWIKYVDESGTLQSMVCPSRGKVKDLLQMVDDNTRFLLDERVELCRKQNPGPMQ